MHLTKAQIHSGCINVLKDAQYNFLALIATGAMRS